MKHIPEGFVAFALVLGLYGLLRAVIWYRFTRHFKKQKNGTKVLLQ